MAKAKKLPSGNWRVQASVTIDGEKYIRSFTESTAAKAEKSAEEWRNYIKMIGSDSSRMTVKEAMKFYIEKNRNNLSPSTVKEYVRISDNDMQDIINKPLYTLTCPIIQNSINNYSSVLSPKTIKNRYGFLQTILSVYHPQFIWAVKYPKMKKTVKKVYSDEYIKQIFRVLKGNEFELESYLGMLSMRASEIGGLKWEDIDFKNKTLQIHRTKLKNEHKEYVVVERTKTEHSARTIYLPDYVIRLLKKRKSNTKSEFVSSINPELYWKRLNRILEKNNIESLGFHKLRHIYSTVTSRLGIDTQIRMENGGWSDEKIMNRNYRHAMTEAQLEANKKMNSYVNNIAEIHTKIHTKNCKRLKLMRYGL